VLNANVKLFNTWSSSSVRVASVVDTNPTVNSDLSMTLSSDSNLLTLTGQGFEATRSSENVVQMNGGVKGLVAATSPSYEKAVAMTTLTRLVVSFTHLAPSNKDLHLTASVTVSDLWSSSGGVQVSKIVDANPEIKVSSDTLNSDAYRLTVNGKGFDATTSTANAVMFIASGNESVRGLISGDSSYNQTTASTTLSRLVVSFTHLAPTNKGTLRARVIISDSWSDIADRIVANVEDMNPTLDTKTTSLSSDSALITITGRGFDATSTVKNVIEFEAGNHHTSTPVKGLIWAHPDRNNSYSTLSTLAVSFTHLSPLNDGALKAKLQVHVTWSTVSATEVAVIAPSNPTLIDQSNVELSSNALYLTIRGSGFEATHTESNVLEFSGDPVPRALTTNMKTTLSTIILSFTHLSPTNEGVVSFGNVTVLGTWISNSAGLMEVIAAEPQLMLQQFLDSSSNPSNLNTVIDREGTGGDSSVCPDGIEGDNGQPTMRCKAKCSSDTDSNCERIEVLSTDALKITLTGSGFDSTTASRNLVKMYAQGDYRNSEVGFILPNIQVGNTDIKGLVSNSTRTTLVLSFTHLAPSNALSYSVATHVQDSLQGVGAQYTYILSLFLFLTIYTLSGTEMRFGFLLVQPFVWTLNVQMLSIKQETIPSRKLMTDLVKLICMFCIIPESVSWYRQIFISM